MERLSGPASVEVRDCCGGDDCCRLEKHGSAPAALSIKSDSGRASALPFGYSLPLVEAASASCARLSRLPFLDTHHPPPGDGRDTRLRISLFRI